jgi:MFS family permease
MHKLVGGIWALLLGVFLLMIGNGMQGSLIGIRASVEGFSTYELAFLTSGYFFGFLGGSTLAPEIIRRVGHVRVFAALASLISASLIVYPIFTNVWAWVILRVIVGFCFSGVYVTAESWLNNSATNKTRGKILSLYLIVQMVGIVSGQALLNIGDVNGYLLFIIPSILISISFTPILLSVSPGPTFETTKKMSLRSLYKASPLGFVGMFIIGGIFSAQFGMSAVYGAGIGLSVGEISIFVSSIFIGGICFQYPIGWISDRIDRRVLIMYVSCLGGIAVIFGYFLSEYFWALVLSGFLLGGFSNPLYSLLIAYTNDYLDTDDMAAASGGLIFIGGVGAVIGPFIMGWLMSNYGPSGFWLYLIALMGSITLYAGFRITQRSSLYSTSEEEYDPVSYANIGFSSTQVVGEAVQDFYVDNIAETK